jgi:hypothetical protein
MFSRSESMGFARSHMSIIDPQLVDIEICALSGDGKSALRLNYQSQSYDLIQAFASNKLERADQKMQQLIERNSDAINKSSTNRYLLVREVGYYSLWAIDSTIDPSRSNQQLKNEHGILALQQASIWLLQELWLQWQDLLGAKQLQLFAEQLLTVTPQLQSWVDLDRLLLLDPLAPAKLEAWSELDFTAFDRQLYHLTQKKIGQQFGTELTIEIIQTMPNPLKLTLLNILDI